MNNQPSDIVVALETEVEQTVEQWKKDPIFHKYLYLKYLDIEDSLFEATTKFRCNPSFHRIHNEFEIRQAYIVSKNIAHGAGTVDKRPREDSDEGTSSSKRHREGDQHFQHTSDTVQLRSIGYKHMHLFGLTTRRFDMQMINLDKVTHIAEHVESCFEEALDKFKDTQEIAQTDEVGLVIDYENLKLNKPVFLKLRPFQELDAWTIMRNLIRVLNSNQHINMADPVSITFTHLKMPTGGGPTKLGLKFMLDSDKNREHYNKGHGHLLTLPKHDQLCLPKCIVLAQAKSVPAEYERLRRMRNSNSGELVDAALKMLKESDIEHTGPCSLMDVSLIQEKIKERIMIYCPERAMACIWDGRRDMTKVDNRNRITLQLDKGHFDIIQSMPGFFGTRSYCFDCQRTFDKMHRCTSQCSFCLVRTLENCPPDGTSTVCEHCNRVFKSTEYYNNHKLVLTAKKAACELIRRCKDCSFRVTIATKHKCGHAYCTTCKTVVPFTHVCYVKKPTPKKPRKGDIGKVIYFDFESKFRTGINGKDLHRPVFAVAQVQCSLCSDVWNGTTMCDQCKEVPQIIIKGEDTIDYFCRWLFADNHKLSTAVCHNFKNYDGMFITEWLSNEPKLQFKITPRGLSILCLECNYVRVICSTNFLAVALRKLPAMFNFDHEIEKGEFPYRLITDKDELTNDATKWPALELYDPDSRSVDERDKLISWHQSVADKPFYPLEQLTNYCIMDVTILRRAMTSFAAMFQSVSNIHPFQNTFTIASACSLAFRMNNMPPKSLMIYKEEGPKKTSKKCIDWLSLMENDEGIVIKSSQSTGGESNLKCGARQFVADGICQDDQGNVTHIYEFYGCYWHAWPMCFKHSMDSIWMSGPDTFRDKFEQTIERMDMIKSSYPDAQITEIWEHDFDELAKTARVVDYLSNRRFKEPLNPRNALFGGRTEVCQMIGQCEEPDWAAIFLDIVSQYPSVQMHKLFPIGEYKLILNATVAMMIDADGKYTCPWLGLIQVKILPTKRLIHACVPFRTPGADKKLTFPLCSTCALTASSTCAHTVEERSWWTTLCSVELKLAFKHGYIALDVGEVWHYDKWMKYDPKVEGSGLFSDYIISWMTKKVESSGYPSGCVTDEQKQKFIDDYKEMENIILTPDKIKKNLPLKNAAKNGLTNLWGKFAQRNDQTKYSYFKRKNLSDFYKLKLDPNQKMEAAFPVGDDCVCVVHKNKQDSGEPCSTQSVVIGCFVTAYGRRKLFKMLHKLGDQAIYCDTDSVIFNKDPNGFAPGTSPYLGGWSPELEPDEYIVSYVVCAPKAYSLKVKGPNGIRYVTKSKGFTLDYKTSLKIHHESMRKLVTEFIETGDRPTIETHRHAISKNRQRQVYSETLTRRFRVVNNKRTLTDNSVCRPFGYNNPDLID